MVQYLLHKTHGTKDKAKILNSQSDSNKESPLFYALNSKMQKSVPHHQRLAMVNLLLGQDEIDLDLKNKLGQKCYEAHADGYGYDELTALAEARHAKGSLSKKEHNAFFKPLTGSETKEEAEKQILS